LFSSAFARADHHPKFFDSKGEKSSSLSSRGSKSDRSVVHLFSGPSVQVGHVGVQCRVGTERASATIAQPLRN